MGINQYNLSLQRVLQGSRGQSTPSLPTLHKTYSFNWLGIQLPSSLKYPVATYKIYGATADFFTHDLHIKFQPTPSVNPAGGSPESKAG